jgi:signal transduction histidine kinase
MRTADQTLRRHADRLDDVARAELADALSAELARLQVLIEPGRPVRRVAFALVDVIVPVVTAECCCGGEVLVAFGQERVEADPDALGQVVQNLLVNARRYASGSPVSVTARSQGIGCSWR